MKELRPSGPLTHLAILASAGTGKTHALAHRYIGLLGRGVEADRICALTFSRKAATEIFDSIVQVLVKASQTDSVARQSGEYAGLEGLTSPDSARLLRSLVDRLHRVQIGTLDSFIVGVLRAFSAELGLPPDFTLLDTGSVEARLLARESLDFLIAPSRSHADHRDAFFQSFKKATYGREEKGFSETFFQTLNESLFLFRRLPDPDCWGNPAAIWTDPRRAIAGPADEVAAEMEIVRSYFERRMAVMPFAESLAACLQTAAIFLPFNAWRSDVFESTLMARLFESLPALDSEFELVFNRKNYLLPAPVAKAVQRILRRLVRQELIRSLHQTQGLGAMLAQFHALYEQTIRRRGAFTFNDAQFLLTPRNAQGAGVISRVAGGTDRLYIDYRLDARLDHWLLDEFQDTSDLQWETLDNLASEIIQDTSGTRSFFLVGDVKQAIHAWRGGNPRLFGRLLDRYGSGIQTKTLSESYRSTPPVLELVNRAFSDISGLDLPEQAVSRWQALWTTHVSKVDQPGCAAWIEPEIEEDESEDGDALYRTAAGLIRELDPLARRLSIAVLLPTNADCTYAADCLRRELAADMVPVVNEGAAELAGNPVVALMRALLRYAAHPGDTLAHLHLRMSPLAAVVDEGGESLPLALLKQIQEEGFVPFFRQWAVRLEAVTGLLDAFGKKRLRDLLALAEESDARGNRDCDALVEAIDSAELREQTAGGAVRIMTIHQSKGLGFDVVLAPLLKNDGLATTGSSGLLLGGTEESPWVLKMPRQIVCRADPVLADRLKAETAETAFSSLCVLYVALTRARQGLYILSRYGKNKKSRSTRSLSAGIFLSRRLLDTDQPETVAGDSLTVGGVPVRRLFLEGNWTWADASRPAVPETQLLAPSAPVSVFTAQATERPRLKRVEPSRSDTETRQAAWLFNPEARGVLDFGLAIHELLAKVEWSGTSDPAAIVAGWTSGSRLAPDVRKDAERQFLAVMNDPAVSKALAKPGGKVELWREQSFELIDGDSWISGTFDRVAVCRDAAGKAVRAELFDFKSNRIETEADMARAAGGYRRQLSLYRMALARLLAVGEDKIAVTILFTRPAKLYSAPC